MTRPADSEARHMQAARRWFTAGWTGDLAMASRIFSEDLRINGVQVLALPGRQGRRDPDHPGPVRDLEADRVSAGERLRRLSGLA